ncbi:MAG: calcium:proton antiporter [Corynebacterium sp.]|uniref:calcium:proton antiporter n=1 Tax=uncultured Corynebacterium sp. TaxID=159447 RepID=UPI00185490F5|nr:calcium:proton antiporter [uncultured Corynebacterium sp.]NLZ57643.1 calcium:proton antiporter [Corynebacterium sp.]
MPSTSFSTSFIDYARIILGWATVALFLLLALPGPPALLLTVIIAVILFCSFGVVKQAERLAVILGDPYGSLVLTLSIVIIEVILIAAVMLGPGESASIARDSVMAVSMIIMALVVGVSFLVGGLRHGALIHNGTGAQTYLTLILLLSAVAFAVPAFLSDEGDYAPAQGITVAVCTMVLYAFFLWRQMGAQATDFQDSEAMGPTAPAFHGEVIFRIALLVVTVLPIVWLSHDMAGLMDTTLTQFGAPIALAGLVIAMIVFLPETITTVRAAWGAETQRVINLAHGALVSTLGLTIPSVLIIGNLTGQQVILGETPINLLLLGATIAVTGVIFSARKITAVHGAVLLMLFGIYMMALLA